MGRPNVGKSTLLNRLIGQKISITSPRAQTTRHRVMGIRTDEGAQFVFVDTPGIQTRHRSELNRRMNRAATDSLTEVDAAVLLVEAMRFTPGDRQVLDMLPGRLPVVLAINKTDALVDRRALLPFIARVAALREFHAVVPISARTGDQTDELLTELRPLLPEGPALFPDDEVTDRSERFLASEFLREKLFRLLGEELPYGAAVVIEAFETEGNLRRISAVIVVERAAHRAMIIGQGGEKLKDIATQARMDLERLFGSKVFLEVWVKVRGGWTDDPHALSRLGYE